MRSARANPDVAYGHDLPGPLTSACEADGLNRPISKTTGPTSPATPTTRSATG